MGDISQVQAKVQNILVQHFNGVTLEKEGSFSLRNGSARAFVHISPRGDDGPVIIRLVCPLLQGVKDGPAIYEHVAFHADDYTFGHLSLWRQDDGRVDVFMTHNLLGDYLDEDELGYAVAWLLQTANDLDDELQAQFGGEKFHDE